MKWISDSRCVGLFYQSLDFFDSGGIINCTLSNNQNKKLFVYDERYVNVTADPDIEPKIKVEFVSHDLVSDSYMKFAFLVLNIRVSS